MATDDPNYSYLLRRLEAVEQLLRANPLRNAYVGRGMTEWGEDSTLRITDSNLEVVGAAFISGLLEVVGRLSVRGLGILDVAGLIDLAGRMRIRGGGDITVEDGGDVVVDGGQIRAGDIVIRDGKLFVGENMVLDPTEDGGAALFSNGSKLYSNVTAIGLRKGSSSVTIGDTIASLLVGGKAITVAEDGISLTGVREVTSADGIKWLGITNAGEVVKVAPGVGGPGGALSWPLPPSTVTSEYGPREVTIEGASAFHEGIDFGVAEGTAIPAAGAGRVTFAGPNGGYGNHVRLDHGGGLVTTYSHMQTMPTVSVGQLVPRGYTLGPVGDTGVSGAPHLHFEVQVNGTPVNPRSKLRAA